MRKNQTAFKFDEWFSSLQKDEQFKVSFSSYGQKHQKKLLIKYNLFGKYLKLKSQMPFNMLHQQDLRFFFIKLGTTLQKILGTFDSKKYINQRFQILTQLFGFKDKFACSNRQNAQMIHNFPENTEEKNKLFSKNIELIFDEKQQSLLKQQNQTLFMRDIQKIITIPITLKKNSASINKWVFTTFKQTIFLNELKHFQEYKFNVLVNSKHGNIQIGIVPPNTTIQYFNCCSNQRIAFHLRNLQIYDNFQNSKSFQNKWRANDKKDQQRLLTFEHLKIQVKIKKRYEKYVISWFINQTQYACCNISENLIQNGFKFCIGMFHTNDSITINNFNFQNDDNSKDNSFQNDIQQKNVKLFTSNTQNKVQKQEIYSIQDQSTEHKNYNLLRDNSTMVQS